MKNSDLLYTGSEWTPEIIAKLWPVIDKIGKEDLGLDYYNPQFEIVSADQMIDCYSSVGMPIYYNHWSFGKTFSQTKQQYDSGKQNLAYEMVINSNPCIAYLMENNSATMQAIVMAHANVGHASFFKMNYLYNQNTDPSLILNRLEDLKKQVLTLEEKYGLDHVETLLDDIHAISFFGVDKYPRFKELTEEEQEARRKSRQINTLLKANPDDNNLPISKVDRWKEIGKYLSTSKNNDMLARYDPEKIFKIQEDNLFRVVENWSVVLEKDELRLMESFRELNQYFHPQLQDKIINEGWATFCDYYIMEKLFKLGHIDEGSYLEFLSSHTAVAYQRDFTALNPYSLGFDIFMDVKRACENPDEEDYIYLKSVAGKDWRETFRHIISYYKDESFVQQFLSPKVIRKFRLFALRYDPEVRDDAYLVTGIQDKYDVEHIRKTLSQHVAIENKIPNLTIESVDVVNNLMRLKYTPYKGRALSDKGELKDIMERLTGYLIKFTKG